MTGAHNKTHSEKSGRYDVGRARAQESVRLQQDNEMTRPEDHLDELLVEDVEQLAGTGSCFGKDRGPNLGPGELRERQDQRGLHSEVDWPVTWGNISTNAV